MSKRIIRAQRIADSGLRAYEQGASADQLSEYLQELHDLLEGGEDDPEYQEEPEDAEEASSVDREA